MPLLSFLILAFALHRRDRDLAAGLPAAVTHELRLDRRFGFALSQMGISSKWRESAKMIFPLISTGKSG